MPSNSKFPSSVEIKRVIAAASRVGIEIGSIEIHPTKIIIRPRQKNAAAITDYDLWKIVEERGKERIRHSGEDSDALPKKPSG
ncbi:MAG: hypothetical protein ACTHOI_01865 [Sphingomicrobium sp.]